MIQLLPKKDNSKKSAQNVTAIPAASHQVADHNPPQYSQGKAMKFRFGNGDKPLDGFTIKRGVGVGGFGEVYFATNDAGKEVALKQIQRNLDVEVRGVRHCMNLKHPNLISLYDIKFDSDNLGWIVMEYVSGISLRDALEQNPNGLPVDELNRWFGQIAAGVAYLHDHGIVHRDLKPANIFEDEGIVKIGDYGLSKFISCSRRGGQTESVGTFHYMAPEIGKGEYGKEIDIYALGVMLYELATGDVPFDGESSQEIIMKHLTADPDLSQVHSPIREVLVKALAKNPRHRFNDVRDMVRPLGMDVDDRYLLVRTAPSPLPPVVEPPVQGRGLPPVSNPASVRPQAAFGTAETTFPVEPARPRAQAKREARPEYTSQVASVAYDEPIARSLNAGIRGINRWWNSLHVGRGAKAVILAIVVIVAAMNAPTLVSILVMGLVLYVPYFAVWWLVRAPQLPPSPQPFAYTAKRGDNANRYGRDRDYSPPVNPLNGNHPQGQAPSPGDSNSSSPPPMSYEAPKAEPPAPKPVPRPAPKKGPLSIRQWRVARRMQLSRLSRGSVWSDVTGSWLGATMVIAVVAALATVFLVGSGQAAQPLFASMLWVGLVALAITWTSIGLGKRWQKEEGDWAIRSFVQLAAGFGIGLFAYFLSDFLMVSWSTIPGPDARVVDIPARQWQGFFSPSGEPLLPAFLAYFPLLMGVVHWWKQVDPLRRTRFSFFSVIWVVVAATLVHFLIAFPQQWGALVAATASVAIQLSCSWINPTERLTAERQAA